MCNIKIVVLLRLTLKFFKKRKKKRNIKATKLILLSIISQILVPKSNFFKLLLLNKMNKTMRTRFKRRKDLSKVKRNLMKDKTEKNQQKVMKKKTLP